MDYGQLIKTNGEQTQEGRYGPPDVVATDRWVIQGDVNSRAICTSHVELNNLRRGYRLWNIAEVFG